GAQSGPTPLRTPLLVRPVPRLGGVQPHGRPMNAVPRVSVVVAAYGHGRYIGEALRSVEAQTLREWECIVVDDASTDDTPAVVRDFTVRDPRFRCVRLGRNRGVSVARNTGLREARGEYVQLLDADDLIAPGKLAVQAAYLDR